MAAQIHTALMHLGQALGRLDNAVKMRDRALEEKAAAQQQGGEKDLFSPADRAGQALDTARLARTLDRAIASVEAILKDG